MSAPQNSTRDTPLQRYLAHRHWYEAGLWICWTIVNLLANTQISWFEVRRERLPFAFWEPLVWEASSHLMWLALVPVIALLVQRYPLKIRLLKENVPIHLAASLLVSVAHVVGMVWLRQLAYDWQGMTYQFGNWPRQFLYEYLKDFRSYFLIVALIYLYRLVLLRLQGEASLLEEPDVGPALEPIERPERLLVRKLGKEFLIAVTDIEWLEASENYVNLHVRGRIYPLRSTMTAIEARLDRAKFVRVHRSYIINLHHLAEIEPLEGGDARLLMSNGARISCSRRYRPALRQYGSGTVSASS